MALVVYLAGIGLTQVPGNNGLQFAKIEAEVNTALERRIMNQECLDLQPAELFYRQIRLSKGQFAKVGLIDFLWLSRFHWYVRWDRHTKTFYAERRETRFVNGKRPHYKMHRVIAATTDSPEVDHRNGDTLDNQRHNLRSATRAQNSWNMKTMSTNTSGLKGVSWSKLQRKWAAQIMVHGRHIRLGAFDSKMDAKAAYDSAATRLRGDFARP